MTLPVYKASIDVGLAGAMVAEYALAGRVGPWGGVSAAEWPADPSAAVSVDVGVHAPPPPPPDPADDPRRKYGPRWANGKVLGSEGSGTRRGV